MSNVKICLLKSLKSMDFNYVAIGDGLFGFYCDKTDLESWIYILKDISEYINLNDEYYFFGGFAYKSTREEYLNKSEQEDIDFFYNSFKNGDKFLVYFVAKEEPIKKLDSYFYFLNDFIDVEDDDIKEIDIHPYMMEELFDE